MNVVVLGMHRSGTSAVTRLLGNLGYFIGSSDALIPANEANEDGYWERQDVVALNKSLLEHDARDWTAPQAYDPDKIDLSTFQTRAKALIDSFEQSPYVLKDPRFCITIGEWLPVLGEVMFVVCVRHPAEVAASLTRRNGLNIAVGIALWEYYNANIVRMVDGHAHATIDYAALVANPRDEAIRLVQALRQQGSRELQDPTVETYGHIVSHLKHEHAQRTIDDQLTAQQLRLYRRMSASKIESIKRSGIGLTISTATLDLLKQSRLMSAAIEGNRAETNKRIDHQLASLERIETILTTERDRLRKMRK